MSQIIRQWRSFYAEIGQQPVAQLCQLSGEKLAIGVRTDG